MNQDQQVKEAVFPVIKTIQERAVANYALAKAEEQFLLDCGFEKIPNSLDWISPDDIHGYSYTVSKSEGIQLARFLLQKDTDARYLIETVEDPVLLKPDE